MSDENSNVAVEESTQVEGQEETQVDEAGESSDSSTMSAEEANAALKQAADQGASKEELKELRKMFELKVNGKVIKKEYNLLDEEAMKRELQLAHAGREAMQRNSEYERALQSIIEQIKQDPFSVAAQLGLSEEQLEQLAYDKLNRKVEEAKKPKEVLERERMEKELEEYRQKMKKIEEEKVALEKSRLEERAKIELDKEIDDALSEYKVLPNHPYVIERVARALLWATDPATAEANGYNPEDVKVSDVLPIVESELKKEVSTLLDSLPDEAIEHYMGKKAAERQRQKRLASVKKTNNISNIKKADGVPKKEEQVEKKKLRIEDIPLF